MSKYEYNREYDEIKRLLTLPLKKPGKTIVLSKLIEGDLKPTYDLRMCINGERTLTGLILTEYNLRYLVEFLNEYFAEMKNQNKSEVERMLGYDPFNPQE